ncbi:MAG: ABC transporter ATP-binding protein, partial [Christensenellales bacterium]
EKVFKRFPRLEERKSQLAGTLSGGEQQMLAIGRALVAKPKIILFDEPSLGLAPLIVKEVFEAIREIKQEGTTILLVEQNSKLALNTADRAYVLKNGEIALSGKCSDLLNNEEVKSAYLGAK